jgi:hypothetical protein
MSSPAPAVILIHQKFQGDGYWAGMSGPFARVRPSSEGNLLGLGQAFR